ncbi:MAG: DNA polymerase III [Lachnospiraceae bacterium]|nr:DNA polymerase III [Lachnospiraceae bacterium]
MNYIVFDLEWNQSPGGKAHENPRMPFEIIEIGAVKLNDRRRKVDTFSEVVRPLVYHKLHFRMKEVVPLSEEELSRARTFSRVARDFIKWIGDEEFRFVTWGNLDVMELQRNLDYYRIGYDFGKPLLYYDLQKLYSILNDDGKSRLALEDAVDILKIEKDIPFHRAYDDAYYTAKVMQKIDFKAVRDYLSVDYYHLPQTREEEINLDFPTYSKFVSRVFPDKVAAMNDKGVTLLACPKCKMPVWRKQKWFSTGSSGVYLGLVKCPRHGYVKGKIRMKPAPGGEFAVRTVKLASEEDAQRIRERREQLQEKHRRERRRTKAKK